MEKTNLWTQKLWNSTMFNFRHKLLEFFCCSLRMIKLSWSNMQFGEKNGVGGGLVGIG